mmetsp:Transcript_60451/g.176721  ORF Transcript_60451/g.176721 Transcript_60451/m.176721 type:complete len:511 (+) Transcript_60451:1804-3336(+)
MLQLPSIGVGHHELAVHEQDDRLAREGGAHVQVPLGQHPPLGVEVQHEAQLRRGLPQHRPADPVRRAHALHGELLELLALLRVALEDGQHGGPGDLHRHADRDGADGGRAAPHDAEEGALAEGAPGLQTDGALARAVQAALAPAQADHVRLVHGALDAERLVGHVVHDACRPLRVLQEAAPSGAEDVDARNDRVKRAARRHHVPVTQALRLSGVPGKDCGHDRLCHLEDHHDRGHCPNDAVRRVEGAHRRPVPEAAAQRYLAEASVLRVLQAADAVLHDVEGAVAVPALADDRAAVGDAALALPRQHVEEVRLAGREGPDGAEHLHPGRQPRLQLARGSGEAVHHLRAEAGEAAQHRQEGGGGHLERPHLRPGHGRGRAGHVDAHEADLPDDGAGAEAAHGLGGVAHDLLDGGLALGDDHQGLAGLALGDDLLAGVDAAHVRELGQGPDELRGRVGEEGAPGYGLRLLQEVPAVALEVRKAAGRAGGRPWGFLCRGIGYGLPGQGLFYEA